MKKAGVVCCSNGQKKSSGKELAKLDEVLRNMGILPLFSPYLYSEDSVSAGTARERADALMDFYRDEEITEIFDISGGDVANEILPYLDYSVIKKSGKRFWGYSDLTTVINAIYTKTGKPSVLYQIKNLVWDETGGQRERFKSTELFLPKYRFIRQKQMEGVLVGGNLRCFLKLAGTEYFPDMRDKILVLEARNGLVPQMTSALNQLRQMGVFDQINGILLGTFTEMEEKKASPKIEELVLSVSPPSLPVAKTFEVGHGKDSRAIEIGKRRIFR